MRKYKILRLNKHKIYVKIINIPKKGGKKNMSRRIERAAGFFLVLTSLILEASVILAIFGIWIWGLVALYAVSCICLSVTIFEEYSWRKRLLLFIAMEACQFLSCSIPLGIRAMF